MWRVQEVIDKYNECHLEENKDPGKWITQKNEIPLHLQIDFGKKDYEDKDFKAALVHSLPEPYHAEKILAKDKYKAMSIQNIITLLCNCYKDLNIDTKEEHALSAKENSCVICLHCDKYGHHKWHECCNMDNGKPDVIQPKPGICGSEGRYCGICGYCNKHGLHENQWFKKNTDTKKAHVAEENDKQECSNSSEECVVMGFENNDNFLDTSSIEYIDFEIEQKLFNLFKLKTKLKKEYMLFTLFN